MRTVKEATDYINESIKYWQDNDEEKKIISLSGMAEKWRSKTINPHKIMSDLQKNINAYKAIIERNQRIDPKADNNALEDIISDAEKRYDKLFNEHGEYEPKPRKSRKY